MSFAWAKAIRWLLSLPKKIVMDIDKSEEICIDLSPE
jgi:hypothetical protein